jgi:7-cyano-7-deazaguanine synthase
VDDVRVGTVGGLGLRGETIVLLSGGIDSATALGLATHSGHLLSTLFINYGQAPAEAEGRAASAIARHYRIPHRELSLIGLEFGSGEVRGRNAFLLHVALLAAGQDVSVITIGIHAGTGYCDCSPDFVETMRRSYDLYSRGAVALAAPFIGLSKSDVVALAGALQVPLAVTYSCEAGNNPCGNCLSCLDRDGLLARS